MPASAEPRGRFIAEGCEEGLAGAADDALGAEFAALMAWLSSGAGLRACRLRVGAGLRGGLTERLGRVSRG